MNLKSIHYFSGITITLFVVVHLFNHAMSIFGVEQHIALMTDFRKVYRNIVAEIILLLAVGIQIFSGWKLFKQARNSAATFFEKLQIWSGLYLAIFFSIHLSAVLGGRFVLGLDTNFYFGAAGLNTFPFNLFFVPYYGLAIVAFFGHLAAVHHKKMKFAVLGMSPEVQAKGILFVGFLLMLFLLFALTDGFNGVEIPEEYGVLVGKF